MIDFDKIENINLYNHIFDIYALELEMGDLKHIDGDYLVMSTYMYLNEIKNIIDDGSILIWLYKIYGADKETYNNRLNESLFKKL